MSGNFGEVLRESREMVMRVINLKTRMKDFMQRCITDISEVSVDEYEEIIKQVNDSFKDESKCINNIRSLVFAELQSNDYIGQTEQELFEILKNIDTVVHEQSCVFNQKFLLCELYANMLNILYK